jgi:hypothetical protein
MIEFIIILLVLPAGISLYKYIQPNHKIIKIQKKYDYDFLLMN